MLPEALIGALQRYKEDTDSVAAWLASSAKLCGYQSKLQDHIDNQSGGSSQKGSGRLKGKDRKAAKEKDGAKKTASKHKVAISEFVPMAQCIVACKSPYIKIPPSFVVVLDRVIRLRSSFGSRMTEMGVERNDEADSTHTYFVEILRQIKDVLQPRIASKLFKMVSVTLEEKSIPRGFNALELYEPSQEFLDSPEIQRPQNTMGDTTVYEAEAANTFEDALVVWHLLVGDADRIRKRIRWAWQGYRDGDFDITAAAIATNTGIQMVRNQVKQFSDLFEYHGGVLILSALHLRSCLVQQGFSNEDVNKGIKNGYVKDDFFALHEKTFNYSLILIRLLVHKTDEFLSCIDHVVVDNYGPDFEASLMKSMEDQELVNKFWLEGVLFFHYNDQFPLEDEYLRSIRFTHETEELSFEMAFASQILLDVNHLLEKKSSNGFSILQNHTTDLLDQLSRTLQQNRELRSTRAAPLILSPAIENDIRECMESLESILRDEVTYYKNEHGRLNGFRYDNLQYHVFLKFSPILSGISLFHVRTLVYTKALHIIGDTGVMTCMAHLYNAGKAENLIESSWPDMDIFEANFEVNDFFLGGKPHKRGEYHRRLLLQLGASPSSFTKRKTKSSQWKG
ncbi:hypothetical protein ACHAPA_009145 [Fusarium lateritium]